MDWETICTHFDLPAPAETEALRPGTVAAVYRLRCGGEDYLLRTLTDAAQGEKERRVCAFLRENGFSRVPEILGEAAIDGNYYQLQRYVPGTVPDCARPGVAQLMGETVRSLTETLTACPPVAAADRFDLAEVWETGRNGWEALETGLSLADAEREIAACLAFPAGERQMIHGDLGPWNMLLTGAGELFVIDFGEARMGDPYFDMASALGGLINHTPEESREMAVGDFLAAVSPDRERLRRQLRLWSWRGLAQCARAATEGGKFARFASRFLQALEQSERWLGGGT